MAKRIKVEMKKVQLGLRNLAPCCDSSQILEGVLLPFRIPFTLIPVCCLAAQSAAISLAKVNPAVKMTPLVA